MKIKSLIFTLILVALCSCKASEGKEEITDIGFPTPVMGWSSWNTYHVNISEQLIKSQADAIVEKGLKDAGYLYVNIDDGYFGQRDETGKMHSHPDRFPNTMKPVADYVHSLGLKAGIYSDAGHLTCGSIWDNDANGVGAGLYGHEQQDMDLYLNEWGFDFIKIDYCGAQELGLEEEKRYETICQAIRNTGRDDVSINICRWAFPGTWAARMARSWRISPDIVPYWWSIKSIISKNLYLSAYAGEGHYNDMDMLEIGRGLTDVEEETHFGMWCIMSSPLLIGCDITTIQESSLNLLKNEELIALNQDPLGLQAYVVQRDGDCYVLVKDIEKKHGNVRAVAFYNSSDYEYEFKVDLSTLELRGKTHVRNLTERKDIGITKNEFSYTVLPHNTVIFRMEAETRTEADRYEAEWAYLPLFDDLAKRPKQIVYAASPECSGGMKVHYLGGSEENFAEWKDVYSENGGQYVMTVYYCSSEERKLEVWVNGEKQNLLVASSGGEDKVATTNTTVKLNKGSNDIKMGNSYGWAPDIDMFTLAKEQ